MFASRPYAGNPVAVVLDGDGIDDATMLRIARWTNLSETTFVLAPSAPGADYRARILTPAGELPFAGHPTLGTCHAWAEAGGEAADADEIVQECGAGLIPVRRLGGRLAFAGPPFVRSGPADEDLAAMLASIVGVEPAAVAAAEWVDNGPGWVALLLDDVEALRAARPGAVDAALDHKIGLVAMAPPGSTHAVEVRAFFPVDGMLVEDPVTGSLNASVAQWLLATDRITAPYVARQGAALGRSGEVHISTDADGKVWVAGATHTCVEGWIAV